MPANKVIYFRPIITLVIFTLLVLFKVPYVLQIWTTMLIVMTIVIVAFTIFLTVMPANLAIQKSMLEKTSALKHAIEYSAHYSNFKMLLGLSYIIVFMEAGYDIGAIAAFICYTTSLIFVSVLKSKFF